MSPEMLQEIRKRVAEGNGMHNYDDGCQHAERDRLLLLDEVDWLVSKVEMLRGMLADAEEAK